jgi:hypothetical protein
MEEGESPMIVAVEDSVSQYTSCYGRRKGNDDCSEFNDDAVNSPCCFSYAVVDFFPDESRAFYGSLALTQYYKPRLGVV